MGDYLCSCGHPKSMHHKNSADLTSVSGCQWIREPETNKTCGCGKKWRGTNTEEELFSWMETQFP